jgi:hypothetical protein
MSDLKVHLKIDGKVVASALMALIDLDYSLGFIDSTAVTIEDVPLLPERAASLSMTSVILWTNGTVMVFDEQGQQMPYYQGVFEGVAHKINNVFCGAWEYGNWNRGIICDVPLEQMEIKE